MNSKLFILIVIMLNFLFSACSISDSLPKPEIIGLWKQRPVAPLFAGENFEIQFNADSSFQMRLSVFNDGIILEPCPNNAVYYISGNYRIYAGVISFYGQYTDSNFSTTITTCEGWEYYQYESEYHFAGKELVLDVNQVPEYRHWLVKTP